MSYNTKSRKIKKYGSLDDKFKELGWQDTTEAYYGLDYTPFMSEIEEYYRYNSENLYKHIDDELSKLDRGIVATPTQEYLDSFAEANNGSNDFLLMQMAKNYGYKLALLNVENEIAILNAEKDE